MKKSVNNLPDFYEEFRKQLVAKGSTPTNYKNFVKKFEFGGSGEQITWIDEHGKKHWKEFNPWVAVILEREGTEFVLSAQLSYWVITNEYRPWFEIEKKLETIFSDYSREISLTNTGQSNKKNQIIWWIGGGVVFIFFGLLLVYLLRKRKKVKQR